jgi:hypothetical protein
MKNILSVMLSVILVGAVFGQAPANEPQRVLIEVQQKAAEPPKSNLVVKANEWVEFGKNVGTAMDAGLSSLTENANKFAKTDAGMFTMAVIAWKVAGRDALDLTNRTVTIVLGVPILIAINLLFIWFVRRNFMAHRVIVERQGPWYARTSVKWETINDRPFSESKTVCAVLVGLAFIAFNWAMIAVIL